MLRQFSDQPPHWNRFWRDFSEVRGGSGGSFRKGAYPDPPNPCFFQFPCFFRFPIFLAFLCVFPLFSKDFRGSAKRKTLAFLGKNPCFFQKSKDWRVRVDFLEVALVWKFPYGNHPKQSSKKFASEPSKLLRSPFRSGPMRKLVAELS